MDCRWKFIFSLITHCIFLYSKPEAVNLKLKRNNIDIREKERLFYRLLKEKDCYLILISLTCLTIVRECFREFLHVFLMVKIGFTENVANIVSGIFSFAGIIGFGITFILILILKTKEHKFAILKVQLFTLMFFMIIITTFTYVLANINQIFNEDIIKIFAIIIIFIIGFLLISSYILLQIVALELSDTIDSASISSLFDGVSYLFAGLYGYFVESLLAYGWSLNLLILTIFCLAAALSYLFFTGKKIVTDKSKEEIDKYTYSNNKEIYHFFEKSKIQQIYEKYKKEESFLVYYFYGLFFESESTKDSKNSSLKFNSFKLLENELKNFLIRVLRHYIYKTYSNG